MKRLIAIAAVAAASLALASCERPALGSESTDNTEITVQHLFTVDGCKVYRFEDDGYNRYLTTCPGSVESRVSSGPTTRPESIQTVEVPQ